MIEKLGGRKFVLTILLIIVGTILLSLDKIDAGLFWQMCTIGVVGYGISNGLKGYN